MVDGDIDDDLQKALALSMQVGCVIPVLLQCRAGVLRLQCRAGVLRLQVQDAFLVRAPRF